MKYRIAAFIFLLSFSSLAAFAQELPTVDHVDLTRYQGKWYEIASIPQFFQRKCAANTTAEYEILANGEVKVFNSCETEKGERTASEGRARVVDTNTNAKLEVTFLSFAGKYFYFAGGKYWIIYLEPNYQYAVVGHPDRDYGWILSRNPRLDAQVLEEMKTFLAGRGYDVCKFKISPQDGGLTEKKSLCE